MQEIILSICIPTVNRASILNKALTSLLSYDAFDEKVQLVIGDNASGDNTGEIVEEIIKRYPDRNCLL